MLGRPWGRKRRPTVRSPFGGSGPGKAKLVSAPAARGCKADRYQGPKLGVLRRDPAVDWDFLGFWGVVMIFWGCGVVLVGVGGIGLKKIVNFG